MRVNVINAGTAAGFDYMLFQNQNPVNQQYIQNQLSQFNATLTDVGRNFIEASRAIYEKVNDSTAIRAAKAAVRMAKGLFHPNAIVPLETLDEIRAAQPMMQRWIMAHEGLRQLYHKQLCDGYSDTYVDMHPGKVGPEHYDWRRIMSGIVTETVDENGDDSWKAVTYCEDLYEGDVEPDFMQKMDILRTHDIIDMFIAAGQDPSNIFGGEIGAI